MNLKIIVILPYFGRLPNYFNLFLLSAKMNQSVDWLIITDDRELFPYPPNVKLLYMSWDEMRDKVQSLFDFQISLDRPHKLCDYKPAYGEIFRDDLLGYDYWAHCDPDIIWGNICKSLSSVSFERFDKVFMLGHFTLYKNFKENNVRFKMSCNGEERYRRVYSSDHGFAFDEKAHHSINSIFIENNYSLCTENLAADIDPYHTNFRLSLYDYRNDTFKTSESMKQLFTWEDGSLYRYRVINQELIRDEFQYIHLQKRRMKVNIIEEAPKNFLITPKSFENLPEPITLTNFSNFYRHYLINDQYIRVKFNSLKFRLKYGLF